MAHPHKHSHSAEPYLQSFLADQDDATKEKYAQELDLLGNEWGRAAEYRYAESLVYFGLAERKVEPIFQGEHIRGSRAWFRKAQKTTTTVTIPGQVQTAFSY